MTTIAPLALAAALAGATAAQAAEPFGLWATPSHGGQVQISPCGAALCGRLITADNIRANPALTDINNRDPALRKRPVKGLPMLTGFIGGPARWTGGRVYNPEDGRTYSGSIELVSADRLKLRGCVIAPLCKTQVWTRVK